MLSVNQINAQVKMTEIWKSVHLNDYPLYSQKLSEKVGARCTRASDRGDLIINASTQKKSRNIFK